FAAFIGLRNEVLDGPPATELFDLPLVALATGILLTSSLASVLAVQAMNRKNVKSLMAWLGVTVALGLGFLALEIYEFLHYIGMGHNFKTSAFSSSFYSLVGFHGAHVILGVVWISLLIIQLAR